MTIAARWDAERNVLFVTFAGKLTDEDVYRMVMLHRYQHKSCAELARHGRVVGVVGVRPDLHLANAVGPAHQLGEALVDLGFGGLEGLLDQNLLIVHGDFDDNVHYQNAIQMVDALIEANKQFDFMVYPGRNHSIYGGNTTLHLFTMITDFIVEQVATGEGVASYP